MSYACPGTSQRWKSFPLDSNQTRDEMTCRHMPDSDIQLLPDQEGCMSVSMANLWDTWGITSRSGSLVFFKGEPEEVWPLKRLCDLGERGELLRGDNGGVAPSLNTVGSNDKLVCEVWVGLPWLAGTASPWASWSKVMTCFSTGHTCWYKHQTQARKP